MSQIDPKALDLDALLQLDRHRPGRLGLPRRRSRVRAAVNLFLFPVLVVASALWLAGVIR